VIPLAGMEYQPAFLPPTEAFALLDVLEYELAWQQYKLVLFGKAVPQPRLTAWCCDAGVRYSYSGLRLVPTAWHPALLKLKRRLESEWGACFNSVLANAYRDGRDSMGWHADDEAELGAEPVIASVSLGATRVFRVRPRQGGPSSPAGIGMKLEHGSVLLMRGNFQRRWQHCVPKTKRPVGLRINLTFRQILRGRARVSGAPLGESRVAAERELDLLQS